MNKEINIIFCDNLEALTLNQMKFFWECLTKMQEGTKKEKKCIEGKEISTLNDRSFFIKINDDIKINFIGETIVADMKDEEKLDANSLIKVEKLVEKNRFNLALYVVDLCLDSNNQNPLTGDLFGKKIKELHKEDVAVLYMSGNINFWQSKGTSDESWFVYRACREDTMNATFEASAASPYTSILFENFEKENLMFDLIKYLLCSKFYDKQYLGVVLLKACMLLKNNESSVEEKNEHRAQ